jgi:hypothetical protein
MSFFIYEVCRRESLKLFRAKEREVRVCLTAGGLLQFQSLFRQRGFLSLRTAFFWRKIVSDRHKVD